MLKKQDQISKCIMKVEEMLEYLRPNNGWRITYSNTAVSLDDWDIKRLGIIEGEEYIYVYVKGSLLYAINVTADSVLCAMSELLNLLTNKF